LKRKLLPTKISAIFDFVKPKKKVFNEKAGSDCTKEEEMFPFTELPLEIRVHVLCFVEAPDLLNLSLVDRQLNELINRSNILWKPACYNKWSAIEEAEESAVKSLNNNWKRYFHFKMAINAPEKSACFHWKIKDVSANSVPSARQSLSACNLHDNRIVYIGGQTSVQTRFDDVFIYNTDTRTFNKLNIEEGTIPKFARHAAASVGDRVFVFGGYDGVEKFFGLSVLDTVRGSWYTPSTEGVLSPIPRTNHQFVSVGDKIYLFGGNDTTRVTSNPDGGQFGTFGDFWQLDTATLTWSEPKTFGNKKPCARSGHHMVVVDQCIYLFGGGLWNDKRKVWSERFNDMWVMNTETMTWKEIQQKSPPTHAFISLPCWRMGPFIFVYNDSLYCFDILTGSWTVVKTRGSKPQKRFLGSASFVESKGCAYMFAGVYSSVVNCFDELSLSPPKNFMTTMMKAESAAKREEQLINVNMNDK